jgi:hypothetical protein
MLHITMFSLEHGDAGQRMPGSRHQTNRNKRPISKGRKLRLLRHSLPYVHLSISSSCRLQHCSIGLREEKEYRRGLLNTSVMFGAPVQTGAR